MVQSIADGSVINRRGLEADTSDLADAGSYAPMSWTYW